MSGYEEESGVENLTSSKPTSNFSYLSLQKAIEMGEYEPSFLSQFEEWNKLTRHSQFQLIRQALKNREVQLRQQWAEIFNFLEFSKKPELQQGLDNIQEQIKQLNKDQERLYLEYSK